MVKVLLSGNEAVALGAWEAGVNVGTGYPGTPSTEILENLTKYKGVYTEWSVNEKVALEVGLGAAFAGARTIVTMKHVGLNVAADPLFTSSYTGIKGGLVIVSADDPEIHSSQNEQDNRNYAYHAKVLMLDPSDSEEARQFTRLGLELSEKYDTPVLLRMTTRISHSMTVVEPDPKPFRSHKAEGFRRDVKKYVMIPAHARLRHDYVEKRMARLAEDVNSLAANRMEIADTEVGFITGGVCYTYVREVFPEASVLKIATPNPLPQKLITEFCAKVKKVFVVEELDPFMEMRIKSWGLTVEGKKYLPAAGELTPDILREVFADIVPGGVRSKAHLTTSFRLPPRPPSLCPGCPHRLVFTILGKLGATVTGDIGCYTLGVLPPFNAMDTCVEMGGSIGVAQGIEIASGENYRNTVAVIGDSTFAHSGITGLVNAAYNKRNTLVIILDNGTTAMTGMQPNPLSGERINGEPALQLDYLKLAEAIGIKKDNVRIADAYAKKELEALIPEMIGTRELSLLVVKGPCVIFKRKRDRK
ncbi:MAG: indolepyruvate ferredoxin oxidoreductase subunit alpha [Spirochaetales bacterium]|nr:indolepyruvate ferredoxin oxidoreductase subunit alpha [Spirochaetales bacterium]